LASVAAAPDQLTLARHRDLPGQARRPYVRWGLLTLLGLFVLLGLLNVFGQRPHTDTASADGIELEVYSPQHLRSGLFYTTRFTIHAERDVKAATLVLDPGWLEGITLEELAAAARLNQLDSLDDVKWAVLETNGRISFVPKT